MSGGARSRRDVLRGAAGLALALGGASGCKKTVAPYACTDTSALPPDDANARTTLGYVEPAPDGTKSCASCQQFVPAPTDGACGSCKVLKGPIHPAAGCKVFTAKPS